MKILVLGGTKFFGIPMIHSLLNYGHEVTIATRGNQKDPFGHRVTRIIADRQSQEDLKKIFQNMHYDLVIDKIAYASNDIKKLLDVISCDRYMLMSTTAVYEYKQDFDPYHDAFLYLNRNDDMYRVTKRYAECALFQDYPQTKNVVVRYPFVVGLDDYTQRVSFYIDHILNGKAMFIDNLDTPLHFIDSQEAGDFMAFLANENVTGIYDGASVGTLTTQQLITIIENITHKKAILDHHGDPAPYNGTPYFDVDTSKALELGYYFSDLSDWIELLVKDLLVKKEDHRYFIDIHNYLEFTTINNQTWIYDIHCDCDEMCELLLSELENQLIVLKTNHPLLPTILSFNFTISGGYSYQNQHYHILTIKEV